MKLLVLGAGGMAGHVAAIRLAELGHSVTGFAREPLDFCETITGDAMTADLPNIVCGFDAVINCIGILNAAVDADPYSGIWLNSCLPHLLAKHSARVIHISSDCVFSGHDGGFYKEDDFRSSDTMYGRSKALGELADSRNLTIRTSIVGPDINENGIGLFNWFMKQQGTVSGYAGAIWGGVTTIALADAIHDALDKNIIGVCHLTNGREISKFEMLGLFNRLRKVPVRIDRLDEVREDRSLVSCRGHYSFVVPSYEDMVMAIGKWIREKGSMYSYNIVGSAA